MSKKRREFDFSRFKQRHIALKLLYFGWDYDGLAEQKDSSNTVEHHLFDALVKTCLIKSRESCNYNRCGRTDKGVSSFGQVVNLNIRSNLLDETEPQNVGLFTPEDYKPRNESAKVDVKELNYVNILNRVLPENIKAIYWAPDRTDFSSRFSCKSRSYSYIFPIGDLCIESMQRALTYLVGEHDFRNLCSFDLKHGVTNHNRTIISARIEKVHPIEVRRDLCETNQYTFYQIIIVGQAFLYHQIRCIMTILFLVGTKKEAPEVVRDLLDMSRCDARPNYTRASPMPLSLFQCEYDGTQLPLGWTYDRETLQNLIIQMKHLWLKYKTKSLMVENVLRDLTTSLKDEESDCWKDFGLSCDNMSDSKYTCLLKRPRDESLEVKLSAIKEKKIKVTNQDNDISTSRQDIQSCLAETSSLKM